MNDIDSVSRDVFTSILNDVAMHGRLVKPRGELVVEIENYGYALPPYVRFQSFTKRKLSMQYIKDELLWYLKGDRYDLSIAEKAKIWQGIVNADGSLNSNYGAYIFNGPRQFDNATKTLLNDRDTRRASMMILGSEHLVSDTKDVPCTYAINFRIRENMLNMSVHMRSQDAIFGMGCDAPAFSFMHEMMYHTLKAHIPELMYGEYFHIADSFHVYERHFQLLKTITGIDPVTKKPIDNSETDNSFKSVDCPMISCAEEVAFLRALKFDDIPSKFVFTKWLVS